MPAGLDFDATIVDVAAVRTLTLSNAGGKPLTVASVTVDPSGAETFSLRADPGTPQTPWTLRAGERRQVAVVLSSHEPGRFVSELVIQSDDPERPARRMRMVGVVERLPSCDFEVSRSRVDFGALQVGQTASEQVAVRNVGDSECIINDATTNAGAPFSVEAGTARHRLDPQETAIVRVRYAPATPGRHTGALSISISSVSTPVVVLDLSGEAVATALRMVPNPLDFGAVNPGCGAVSRTVTLYHDGVDVLEILGVSIDGDNQAFAIDRTTAIPATLQGPAALDLIVLFTAASPGARHTASLVVGVRRAGGTDERLTVPLAGEGASTPSRTDRFQQLAHPQADILFVVDDSCSMVQEQMSIAANFAAFAQFAVTLDVDYRIGVTTTDLDEGSAPARGRLVPLGASRAQRLVSPRSTPSPAARFATNVNVGLDPSTFTERGFEAAYRALSSPLVAGHNAGFLRRDAYLAVIFVSDEDDQSSRSQGFYTDFFASLKGEQSLFTASAIVGDLPDGCVSGAGMADPGTRYSEIVEATGGVFESICTGDWAATLERLSYAAFGLRRRFELSQPAVPATITVAVDGVALPAVDAAGAVVWTFDSAGNAVVFAQGSTPTATAQIIARYQAACD